MEILCYNDNTISDVNGGACPMRIGILGGAFDPIHSGHVDAALAAMGCLGLDRVLVLPSGEPPYKRCHASRADRMRMVELACEGHAGMIPCDIEINRPGKTYTVDTLRALKVAEPGNEFCYILGMDAVKTLEKWRGIDEIRGLVKFAAIGRPGFDAGQVPEGIGIIPVQGRDISSGRVRSLVAEGLPIDGLVPDRVAVYIREQGLYLCEYTEDEILERLKKTISLHRWHHTLGVADTAQRLAARFGVNPGKARLAALLHDCAKSLPYGEMRKLVSENVPDTDELELDAEPVLHAPAGMVLAKRDYGVKDPEILQAIRRHTLGGENMTAMDALIYVSDFIEPGRRVFPGLEEVRALAETDIFAAMRLSAKLSNDYLASRGEQPHPKTIAIATGGEAQ